MTAIVEKTEVIAVPMPEILDDTTPTSKTVVRYKFIGRLSDLTRIKKYSELNGEEEELMESIGFVLVPPYQVTKKEVDLILALLVLNKASLRIMDSYLSEIGWKFVRNISATLDNITMNNKGTKHYGVVYAKYSLGTELDNAFVAATESAQEGEIVIDMRKPDWLREFFPMFHAIITQVQSKLTEAQAQSVQGSQIIQ